MAQTIRFPIWVVPLLLLLQLPDLGAQSATAGFKFSCASWERIEGKPIHYLSGRPKKGEKKEAQLERLKEVDVPEMTRSVIYEFKAGRTVSFFRKKTNAAGEETLVPVATTTVPTGWTRVLFVFFPGKEKGSYRIFSLQDDRVHAPFGSYQFINLSKHQLSGFLGKEALALKPNGRSIIKLRGDEPRSLDFGVWTTIDGQKKWLQRNSLTYRPNKYLVYFFFATQDGRGKLKVKSKGIVDFKPPPVEDDRGTPELEPEATG